MKRITTLTTGEIYHIYSKSIQGFKIFNRTEDFQRMLALVQYYKWDSLPHPFSCFVRLPQVKQIGFKDSLKQARTKSRAVVQLIAYCIMETHIHFILKQLIDDGICQFIHKSFGGYSLYFNLLHNRHGPLWQSRFGDRHIEDTEDLISISHYVHANPVKDMGVITPGAWKYSSFNEYSEQVPEADRICQWQDVIPLTSIAYQESMRQYLINLFTPGE